MNPLTCRLSHGVTIVFALFHLPAASGQDAPKDKAWFQVMSEQASEYEFNSSAVEPITRSKSPVFRHDAPSRNSDDIGGVWIWSDQYDRPVAVGTVFGWTSGPGTRTMLHEFCSLSRVPFNATWKHDNRSDQWTPRETATWKRLPNAAKPTPERRKLEIQLRHEARRFAAHTIDRANKRWELRLIPRPVYQYQSTASKQTLGGAVFVICQDTNTDVVLGIEAVRDPDSGASHFEYALGSFTDWDLRVELDGLEIWSEAADDSRGARDLHWVRIVGNAQLPD